MGSLLERIKNWWSSVEASRRPLYLAGIALLSVLVIASVMIAGKPSMSMLFGGLSPADQGMVVDELNKAGIRAEADTAGNVYVASGQVATARMKLATAKKLPNSGNAGMAMLDSIGPMVSESVEREKLKGAQEAELASSIETLDGVDSARVHLTLQENSPFTRDNSPSTASIVLRKQPNGSFGPEQAQAVARLVQFAVEGLKMENITIVSDAGETLYDGAESTGGGAFADRRLALERELTQQKERDLQAILDGAVGVGNTIVDIPVLKIDSDLVNEETIERGPSSKPVVKEEVSEKMKDGQSTDVGGAAGSNGNMAPPAESTGGPTSRDYNGTQTRQEFEINESRKKIERAPGSIQMMAVNVLVNSKNVKDVAAVEAYVQSSLGPLASDPTKFSATVTPMEFDTTRQEEAKKAAGESAGRDRMQQILAMLPIAALLVVGFLVSKSLGKGLSTTPDPAPEPASLTAPAPKALPVVEDIPNPFSIPDETLTPVSKADLEALAQTPAESMAHAIQAISSKPTVTEFEEIPDKVNIPLEQLKHFANTRPAMVAGLIKTWIAEDRK